jgi:hypothetical protein
VKVAVTENTGRLRPVLPLSGQIRLAWPLKISDTAHVRGCTKTPLKLNTVFTRIRRGFACIPLEDQAQVDFSIQSPCSPTEAAGYAALTRATRLATETDFDESGRAGMAHQVGGVG